MFKIGEFSKLVRVSPRMLRHYEKCGLFYPAEIDRFTGYRTYSAGQILKLTRIVTLRDLGFSIDEIGDILPRFDDVAYMNKTLSAKAALVQTAIVAEQEKLERLRQISRTLRKERKNMVYEVELKKLPSVKVLALRAVIPAYNAEGELWHKLCAFMAKNAIDGNPNGYSIYHDEEYKEADVDVEIAVPVSELKASQGEFVYKELPAIEQAATVRFSGAYDGGYDAASEKLGQWMEQNGYAFAGSLRGFCIVGPDSDSNSENWMTELQAPIVKK